MIENQESGYAADGYPLTVTDWEAQLIVELDQLRPDWGVRQIRAAVGHVSVRARSENNPDLVRRAFLIAAADKARPRDGYRGTYTPKRLTVAGCPFWASALADSEADESIGIDSAQPVRHSAEPVVPVPRSGAERRAASTTYRESPEYLALQKQLGERRATTST